MNKRLFFLTASIGLSLALGACNTVAPTPQPKVASQFIEPCAPYAAQSASGDPSVNRIPCDDPEPDPDPYPTDPEYISMPGTPALVAWDGNRIAPASLPGSMRAQWVPTDATDREDYVRKLFTQVNRNVTPSSSAPVPGSQVVDGRCTVEDVNATTAPEQLLAEQGTAASVFPSVLLQGRYLAVQGNSPTPIHVPSAQRAPVRLVDSYLNTATMPTSSYTDYAQALRQMLVAANNNRDFGQSNVMFDVRTASTVEEASAKFSLDFKAMGADVKSKLDSSSNTSENSVYAVFYQSLYDVRLDLAGQYPVNGLFNSGFGLGEITALGNTGEIDSVNPPAFATGTTLGRILVVRVSSNASSSDLEAAVKVSFKQGSAGLTAQQKDVINASHMTVYAAGGPAEPQIAVLKSGNYLSYFETSNIAISSLRPMAHTINYWDDTLMRVNRTYIYKTRQCAAIPSKKIELRFREVYDNAVIEVKASGTDTFQRLSYGNNPGTVNITPELLAEDAQIRIGVIGKAPSW